MEKRRLNGRWPETTLKRGTKGQSTKRKRIKGKEASPFDREVQLKIQGVRGSFKGSGPRQRGFVEKKGRQGAVAIG